MPKVKKIQQPTEIWISDSSNHTLVYSMVYICLGFCTVPF